MGLREASILLGVSPSTLRRWTDSGGVKSFTTPGGHRRFSRQSILALLPADRRRRPSLERLGETPERLARVYRRQITHGAEVPWMRGLADEDRAPFRDHGRMITSALLSSLDAQDPNEREGRLRDGVLAAVAYGRLAATIGVSMTDTVEIFLRFRRPFFHELAVLARRKRLDTAETTELLESATDAVDELLLATIAAHAAAGATEGAAPADSRAAGRPE